jgi:cold shock CspA family protein
MGGYLAENWSVTNVSSKEYRVIKDIGRTAGVGYVVSDGGTVYLQISMLDGSARGEMKVTLKAGEKVEFERVDGWRIGDVLITTDSTTAISGRIFLKP